MFIVTVRGTKGYGINYGWITPITVDTIECPPDKLGESVLYALKNFSNQWEDSILSVKIKGELS